MLTLQSPLLLQTFDGTKYTVLKLNTEGPIDIMQLLLDRKQNGFFVNCFWRFYPSQTLYRSANKYQLIPGGSCLSSLLVAV